jgi:hypothetical protein
MAKTGISDEKENSMAEPQLPQSSAIRVFIGGVLQPERQVGQGPVRVVATAEALAAGRQPSASQEPQGFSVAPTRIWLDGVQQVVPQQQPYEPPPLDPTLAPRRVIYKGETLAKPAPPVVDPVRARQEAQQQAKRQNLAEWSQRTYRTDEGQYIDKPQATMAAYKAIDEWHAQAELYCQKYGLSYYPTPAEWAAGKLAFIRDESAPPAAPEAAP